MIKQTHSSLQKTALQILADKADFRNHVVELGCKKFR
ncbi:MAG: hypothetical protein ACI8PW_001029 [Methylophilaceae bacterium]|jgi:hypothetical protein